MRPAVWILLVLLLCSLAPTALPAAAPPAAPAASGGPVPEAPGLAVIQRADLMRTVEYLASKDLEGRLAGSPGFMTAARQMADRFRLLHLEPGGEDGYFEKLNIEYDEIQACSLALVRRDGSRHAFRLGPDFVARGFTGSGDFTAPVVFAGYGLSRPASGYDDYAGLDVHGKVVLAFKEAPPFKADTTGWGDSTLPRPKGLVAAAHGAVGLLLVSRPRQAEPQKPIGSTLEGEGTEDERFPRLQLDVAAAQELARGAGLDLGEAQARIDSTHAPASRELGDSVRVIVRASYHPQQPSVNVVAILRGADPRLAGQCVVVGAHLDHVGSQAGEIYFPGANDNASGAASVQAIAAAFARTGVRPRRTVIFALFSSEEAGLFGSKRFVARPPVPLDSIVAYLNLDCVGHGDSIQVGGGKSYPRLWRMAHDLDSAGAKLLVEATWPGGGADAAPFQEHQIPNLYFASRPSYTHLHLTTDTPATLNPALLESIARLAYQTAWKLAQEGVPKE